MTLTETLEYRVPRPNVAQRAMWKVSSSRPGAWLFAKTLHHMDKLVMRLTRGRLTLPPFLAGIPVINLVTTGAKTGKRRAMPLLGVPTEDDQLAVIGTRFGQHGTPGWYFNLMAGGPAEVEYRGRSVPVKAREAGGAEWDAIWARGRGMYAGYEAYARRIKDRAVHIVVLESVG
jgi:deazaflavin-dependent oxidoreductase (nitroreductase family)